MTDIAPKGTPAGWYHDTGSGRMRWWDGNGWTERFAPTPVVVVNKGTNHILHLLLSIVTAGLWIPVWVIVSIVNATKNASGTDYDQRRNLIRGLIALGVIGGILIIYAVTRALS